jgi:hypothetical protein
MICMGMVCKVQVIGVKLCRLKLRVSENQIKVTILTRQVGVA